MLNPTQALPFPFSSFPSSPLPLSGSLTLLSLPLLSTSLSTTSVPGVMAQSGMASWKGGGGPELHLQTQGCGWVGLTSAELVCKPHRKAAGNGMVRPLPCDSCKQGLDDGDLPGVTQVSLRLCPDGVWAIGPSGETNGSQRCACLFPKEETTEDSA